MRTLGKNLISLFNPFNGISRLRYFLHQGAIVAFAYLTPKCLSMLPLEIEASPAGTLLVLFLMYLPLVLSVVTVVQRLKGCSASCLWAVLAFVPIAQVGLVVYLFITPSKTQPSTPEPTGIVLGIWSLVALASWLTLGVLMFFYGMLGVEYLISAVSVQF